MPAPGSTVIAATRAGTVQRHLFLYLDHPSGTVRVWDGLGDYVLGGDTYLGVGGLAAVSGISDSADIQQHEITCTLNNVPLAAMRADDGDVRGVDATITAVLLYEDMTAAASRTIFTGVGDVLKSNIDGDKAQFTLTLRGLLADWSAAPRSFFSPQDQKRLHSGDTGFDYVKGLQDSTVAGWLNIEESSGSSVGVYVPSTPAINSASVGSEFYYDTVTGIAVGDHTAGMANATRATPARYSNTAYVEETTGAATARANVGTTSRAIQVGGVDCYVDINGVVRSAGGKLLLATTTTNYLRQAAPITSYGTATASTINLVTPTGATSGAILCKLGAAPNLNTGGGWTDVVFDNLEGRPVFGDGVSVRAAGTYISGGTTSTVTYVEDVTGTAALVSGGKLQVGSSDCKISTTGLVLSPSGRKIIRSGGDPNKTYLRLWT